MSKINDYSNAIREKKILVYGLGINGGGVESALFFLKRGFSIGIKDRKTREALQVSVTILADYEKQITYHFGASDEHQEYNYIIKNPAIPLNDSYLESSIKNGAIITSDIEIFLQIAPCPVYAVTGSKGKSTVVTVAYEIFKAHNENSFVGGNITISPFTFCDKLNESSVVILELSSWQLRDIKNLRYAFKIAAITNIMNDHQNHYNSLTKYYNDKKIIANFQRVDDILIVSADDAIINADLPNVGQKIYYVGKDITIDKEIVLHTPEGKISLFDTASLPLLGKHNAINISFAVMIALHAGCSVDVIRKGVGAVTTIPFRMETVARKGNLRFVNDTTATVPEAAVAAIESVTAPLIWIAGGTDKNLDFSCFKKIEYKPKFIFLLEGSATEKMLLHFTRETIEIVDSLEAVFLKLETIVEGDETILLSPGCASFGMFQNEFHRGRVFNALAESFIKSY